MPNRLREFRERAKLAQRGLNVKSGVAGATISAIERWDYRPSPLTQERLAKALDVTVADIWPEKTDA